VDDVVADRRRTTATSTALAAAAVAVPQQSGRVGLPAAARRSHRLAAADGANVGGGGRGDGTRLAAMLRLTP